MGKVTVIIQSEGVSTSTLCSRIKEDIDLDELMIEYSGDMFIVPDDEEYPDLG